MEKTFSSPGLFPALIVRQEEYRRLIDPFEHTILLGRSGTGKTTLLQYLQSQIDSDEQLSASYIAIRPAEEQAVIGRLSDLWVEVLQELECKGFDVDYPEPQKAQQAYVRKLVIAICRTVEASGKRLVLLLDNIDRIFDVLGQDAVWLAGAIVPFIVVGACTRTVDQFQGYDRSLRKPFRLLELQPLSTQDVGKLVYGWGVSPDYGKLDTLRRLTDGSPRNLSFLIEVLANRDPSTVYESLCRVMEKATPWFRRQLNELSASQRKIVLQLALRWDPVGSNELGVDAGMESRIISAQLNQLIGKGVVEKVMTDTKNHLYRLTERFFNLWLIFTQGNTAERRQMRCLTIFLEHVYDQGVLDKLARQHLAGLTKGKIDPEKAVRLTNALFQSEYVSLETSTQLIEKTLALPTLSESQRRAFPDTVRDRLSTMKELLRRGEWKKMVRMAEAAETEDRMLPFWQGALLADGVKKEAALALFRKSFNKGFMPAAGLLSLGHAVREEYDRAASYLRRLLVEEDEISRSLIRYLPLLAPHLMGGEWAEQCYLEAWQKYKRLRYVLALARIYHAQGKMQQAESYYRFALANHLTHAPFWFAYFFYEYNRNKQEALNILKESIRQGQDRDQCLALLPVLKVWNGEPVTEEEMAGLIRARNPWLEDTFTELLVQRQEKLVLRLFESPELKSLLMKRLPSFYYVVRLLLFAAGSGLADRELQARETPRELREKADVLLSVIYKRRGRYATAGHSPARP
jgi:tetratricopeptide (TPR) repeat protein